MSARGGDSSLVCTQWTSSFANTYLGVLREECRAAVRLPKERVLLRVQLVEPPVGIVGNLHGREAGQRGEENDAARPNVDGGALVRLPRRDLGRHVRLGAALGRPAVVGGDRKPKVGNLEHKILRKQNILGLPV